MEAFYTASLLIKKAEAQSTEKVSLGHQFENWVASRCGYQILKRNLRLKIGEIDILAKAENVLVLIEVRGRRRGDFCPSRTLPYAKQKRLLTMAAYLSAKYKKTVRVEFYECIGDPKASVKFKRYEVWPERQ